MLPRAAMPRADMLMPRLYAYDVIILPDIFAILMLDAAHMLCAMPRYAAMRYRYSRCMPPMFIFATDAYLRSAMIAGDARVCCRASAARADVSELSARCRKRCLRQQLMKARPPRMRRGDAAAEAEGAVCAISRRARASGMRHEAQRSARDTPSFMRAIIFMRTKDVDAMRHGFFFFFSFLHLIYFFDFFLICRYHTTDISSRY